MYLYVYFRKYTNIKVNYVPCDLLKTEEITGFCKAVKCLYPDGIDILVNNAGKKSMSITIFFLILMELEIAIRIYS
jgi:short-subunit dehydrogenase